MNDQGARPSPDELALTAKNAGEDARAPKGWRKRGFLPHFDIAQLHQMITYRLADSLPSDVAQRLANELEDERGESFYRKRIEAFLDAGHGECVLGRPEIAQIVIDAWQYFDGQRYDLHAWVVMPNHVHVLIAMRERSLSDIVHGWKSFTSRVINKGLGRSGKLWQEDYWDRYIRNDDHYAAAVEYILSNPGARASWPAWYRDASKVGNVALGTRPELAACSLDSFAPANAGEDARAPRKMQSEVVSKDNLGGRGYDK